MRAVIVGDSLTQGIPGVSYYRFLKNKRRILNKGLGGDTLKQATGYFNKESILYLT